MPQAARTRKKMRARFKGVMSMTADSFIFLIMFLAALVLWFLLIELVLKIEGAYKDEWNRLDKPSPWFVGTNFSLFWYIVSGRFKKQSPVELMSRYKILRVILSLYILIFLVFTFFLFNEI